MSTEFWLDFEWISIEFWLNEVRKSNVEKKEGIAPLQKKGRTATCIAQCASFSVNSNQAGQFGFALFDSPPFRNVVCILMHCTCIHSATQNFNHVYYVNLQCTCTWPLILVSSFLSSAVFWYTPPPTPHLYYIFYITASLQWDSWPNVVY